MIRFLQILLISCMLFLSGCAMFQSKSQESNLAKLPKTPTQQMFQTIAKTNWMFTLSIFGVGAGFFAFLNGSSKGLQLSAACLVVISLIIGLTRYSAIIAGISMVGTVGLLGYSMWVRKKAMVEVVQGIQEGRTDTRIEEPVKTFIDYNLNVNQSKVTEAIVKTIKTKLKGILNA